ncbi:hypothetical protein J437_LFUL005994 [Ladona fulva]|uniref:PABS domain-containing protein n=1 Tax=Ladona fulva TaxID=123851 RepID=A0A8K0K2X0_LADFU|nr:hypothetical protein J437_LFUL005994 [Ladona fulva]
MTVFFLPCGISLYQAFLHKTYCLALHFLEFVGGHFIRRIPYTCRMFKMGLTKIDEMVIQACRIHMRKSCGNCLDNYNGPNYKIIVDDCVKKLDEYIEEGRTFDYVFGDLTDVPISPTPQGKHWDFIRLILEKSFRVLKSTGKYMTHGILAILAHRSIIVNGSCSPQSILMYEEQLHNLSVPVEHSSDHAFVPSFLEDWVFYQVWKKD